ncbi:MAG: bifunctional riboflavin kinase/FAD synthetase [Cyanobacteria bacterium J06626_23]
MWITSSLTTVKTPTQVALGNFDGVHLGHQRVIEPVLLHKGGLPDEPLQLAESVGQCLEQSTVASGYSDRTAAHLYTPSESPVTTLPGATEAATVVTFFPHPREFFSGRSRPLLTPLEEKSLQLSHIGVDQLLLLPFNRFLAELSAIDFVEQILISGLQARHISVGSDFHFGKNRQGNADLLSEVAGRHRVAVTVVPLKHDRRGRISSSRIRQALTDGDLAVATELLGRPYSLTGRVVQGQQLGRTIGFPTANLKLPSDKFVPRQGVYSVRVYGTDDRCPSYPQLGVMNIGTRPTVAGQSESVEVFIFNWDGNLYGRTLTVSLEGFLRPEQTFESLDALKTQIKVDCEAAIATLSSKSLPLG